MLKGFQLFNISLLKTLSRNNLEFQLLFNIPLTPFNKNVKSLKCLSKFQEKSNNVSTDEKSEK